MLYTCRTLSGRAPVLGHKELDLHRLYTEVIRAGGVARVRPPSPLLPPSPPPNPSLPPSLYTHNLSLLRSCWCTHPHAHSHAHLHTHTHTHAHSFSHFLSVSPRFARFSSHCLYPLFPCLSLSSTSAYPLAFSQLFLSVHLNTPSSLIALTITASSLSFSLVFPVLYFFSPSPHLPYIFSFSASCAGFPDYCAGSVG